MERRRETVEFMNLCMICRGEKVLVLSRSKQDYPGIVFPGGHVEEGEPFAQAVVREVLEETGLHISAPRLCGVKDWCLEGVRYVVFLYRAETFDGDLRPSPEGAVWWAERRDLPHLPGAVADMDDMLRVLEEDGLSEFFYRIQGEQWHRELR